MWSLSLRNVFVADSALRLAISTTKLKQMRAVSTLRLSDKERDLFLAALTAYGFENSADFLRASARALIEHHRSGDQLNFPLSFQREQRQPN
jgi:hypothetical protein